MVNLGIDLGGTNIAAGLVDSDFHLKAKASVPTGLPKTPEEIGDAIRELAAGLLKENGLDFEELGSVGIGIPGTVNKAEGMVEYANNLEFNNVPFAAMMKKRFPCLVFAENDAKAAAWGEYLAGAGRGCKSMVAVTLGTGVGGGIIFDGRIWDGCNGAAGEIGHMVVERGGRPCTCGRNGCLEAYASATALVKRGREEAGKHPESLLALWDANGTGLDGRRIFEAAEQKDETACQVVEEFLWYLAEGMANLVNLLQPDRICIGGGLSGAGDKLLVPLKKKMEPFVHSRNAKTNTGIFLAELGNDAGLIGAAALGLAPGDRRRDGML